ncbi:AraC family transcriptional regulator [Cyclobacterium plantarum]|uniref:Helix-turn-helix transcriptional regulator n=1 Tax=Cyclobacterium plantarum TaxID=2716263 RepID=A0ABX0HEY9_9BACT|nr:AraC family transcriptional regulator [Cyclobacterium plantarum]NHE58878.1 helix-turn-helix transcriptional regulator [Cyclobacterium plantarum]
MKSIEVRLPQDFDKSFIVFKEKGQYFPCPWHYHPEYELVLVLKSQGRRMVGDHIGYFQEGDLVCMGPYLPHVWVNEPNFVNGQAGYEAEAIVIHFQKDFLGEDFLKIPEMETLKNFLRLSKRGLALQGKAKEQINALMKEMIHMNGIQRLSSLLSIFDILSQTREYELLASPGYLNQIDPQGSDRLDKIKAYIHKNFDKDISLPEAAAMANMAVTTFCNFFKEQYRITFVEYLHTVRLGHACRMLSETDMNIVEVAFECGFNNLANFNRQFKKYKKMTPTHFRKMVNMQEVA